MNRVEGVDTVENDGVGHSQVGESEDVVEGSRRFRDARRGRAVSFTAEAPVRRQDAGAACQQNGQQEQRHDAGSKFSFGWRFRGPRPTSERPFQTVEGEFEYPGQAGQRPVCLARLAPAEPGIGAGVKHHRERLLLLQGEWIELRPQNIAADSHDGGGQCRVAVEHREGELYGIAELAVNSRSMRTITPPLERSAVTPWTWPRWQASHSLEWSLEGGRSAGAAGSPTQRSGDPRMTY